MCVCIFVCIFLKTTLVYKRKFKKNSLSSYIISAVPSTLTTKGDSLLQANEMLFLPFVSPIASGLILNFSTHLYVLPKSKAKALETSVLPR